MTTIGAFETALRARRDSGGKILVPYITGGLGDDWIETLHAVAEAGADGIEIGIPFSDPVMDGPTIQEANDRSLSSGTTPQSILNAVRETDLQVPLAVMTYYNIAFRAGDVRFANALVDAGISAAILPDLPLEETTSWAAAADEAGVETILLAAPTAPDERLRLICERSRGFVYGVGLLGITGVRSSLARSAMDIATRLKAVTDKPVLVGVGIGTPDQAVEVSTVADGVVVGSAIVNRMLSGAGPEGVAELVAEFRSALDGRWPGHDTHGRQ
jgi:tryptophan synthase alpha chain